MNNVTNEDFDDIRAVMNSLRHDCQYIVDIKMAIPIVAKKTGLTEERVIFIIKRYFKG